MKHQLEVVQPNRDYSLPNVVVFKCKNWNCVASIAIERSVMKSLVTPQKDKLVPVGLTLWSECHGR